MGVVCGREATQLYTVYSAYTEYLERGGTLLISLNKVKSMVMQCASLSGADAVAADIRAKVSVPLIKTGLADGTLYLVPPLFFSSLGLPVPEGDYRLDIDRRSMRVFMQMMEGLRHSFTHVAHDNEAILQKSLDDPRCRSCAIKRVLRSFDKAPKWLARVAIDRSRDGGSVTSSVSSGADSSFSIGYMSRNKSVSGLVLEYGLERFRTLFFKKAGRLDLSSQGLNTLDDFCQAVTTIFSPTELAGIRELSLSGNQIAALPAGIFSCFPNLESLSVGNNPLKSIAPKALQGLEHLLKLFIADVPDLDMPADFLQYTPRLQIFFASGCRLKEMISLRSVPHLKVFDVSNNRLSSIPDMSFLGNMRVCNAMDNVIEICDLSRLPRNARGEISLTALQLNDNAIQVVPSALYDMMPRSGLLITLHNNPVWERQKKAMTSALAQSGYQAFPRQCQFDGLIAARDVSATLFADISEKLCSFLAKEKPIVSSVIAHEIGRKRLLANIETKGADRAHWVDENSWWIIGGVAVVTGGVGAGVGYFVKKTGEVAARRAVACGTAGAVGGLAAAYVGCHLVSDGGYVFLDTGSQTVQMTSELKALYGGVSRMVALLAMLKQYLVVCNTCLEWLFRYDTYAVNSRRVDAVITYLEKQMNLQRQKFFARIDDPTTIALLHELSAEDPLAEIKKHTPDDLFFGTRLDEVSLDTDATFMWIELEKIYVVRTVIMKFSAAAKALRAILVNRYLGTYDHAQVCRIVCDGKILCDELKCVVSDIVMPLLTGMELAGETGEAWYKELLHLRLIADETVRLLQELLRHKECLDRIVA
ncbi:MAG: leucine-rich repeat-containing protein-coupled receptor 6 [Candidatus Dependentiae bacterium]|nr:leucine-rich repeat-containing protein-coupled receptor 6 [Candidatus Dependentiae bacterium]